MNSKEPDRVKKNAFSLAEMLLVLLILSFLSISVAPFAVRKVVKKSKRAPHGRYECFYQYEDTNGNGVIDDDDDDPVLMEYRIDEDKNNVSFEPAPGGKCEFSRPRKAAFFILQAIGGGAGGAYISPNPSIEDASESGTITIDYSLRMWNATHVSATGGYNTQTNCSGAGSSGGACPSWVDAAIAEVKDDPATYVSVTFCSAGGTGGRGDAQTRVDGLQTSTGGDGGSGVCGKVSSPIQGTFSWDGNSAGFPNGHCNVSNGGSGGNSSDWLHSGSNGADGVLTGDAICQSAGSAGNGGTGCTPTVSFWTSIPSCSPGAGGYGSYSASTVEYRHDGRKATNRYGYRGESGEYISMFFPVLNDDMKITIGAGGDSGTSISNNSGKNGGDTTIVFGDGSGQNIFAKGGKGTSSGGSYTFWLPGENLTDSAPTAIGVERAESRFATPSSFTSFIELDSNDSSGSKVLNSSSGAGGDGAYSFIQNTTTSDCYYINGVRAGACTARGNSNSSISTYNCMNRYGNTYKTVSASGSYGVCPAQKGKAGAVVILW